MEQLILLNFDVFGKDVESTLASKNFLVLKRSFISKPDFSLTSLAAQSAGSSPGSRCGKL